MSPLANPWSSVLFLLIKLLPSSFHSFQFCELFVFFHTLLIPSFDSSGRAFFSPTVFYRVDRYERYDTMKYGTALVALAGLSSAREINLYSRKASKREVPQEHSHEATLRAANEALQLDNPLNIQDSVFALLGNAAAADGAGDVTNLDCLQQIIADQAFTNAKAAGDLELMTQAILYRALERNTGSVGLASVLCNETATNPEIANIQQHQDPASPEAAGNADIELEVAKSLASIGADPLLALNSATFPPGEVGGTHV